MKLLEAVLAFRKSVFFRVFYLVILSLMVAALLSYVYLGCLTIFLVPLAMFAIPYWLKERRVKHLALNGAVVFVVAALIFAALLGQSLSSSDPGPVGASGSGAQLTNATVTPPRGPAGAYYNFTATLTVPGGGLPSNYDVWVNLTLVDGLNFVDMPFNMSPVDGSDSNLVDGKAYYAVLPVDDHMYIFWFSVAVANGSSQEWFSSPWQVGPVTTGIGPFFTFSLYYGAFSLILPISFYFLILMLFWWTRRARVERQRLGMAVPTESTDTGFMCTNCGADVPADAKACPKCGATFEEEPASSEPEAGDTEGPSATPKTVPSEGEKLEDTGPENEETEGPGAGEEPDAKP